MKRLLVIGAVLLVLPCLALAVDCPVPDPNLQSFTKLDANGNDLPYEATAWTMVRDNVTGLVWEVKNNMDEIVDYNNPHDVDNIYTWYDSNPETNGGEPGTPGDGTDTEDFINTLNSQNFGGYYDWRMPTVKELSSIANSGSPAIDNIFFPYTMSSTYWTSTTDAYFANSAWSVAFYYFSVYDDSKSAHYHYVRAVRGGQCGSFGNYIDNGDGTVTDTDTGLMWQKDTASGDYTWQQALSYCDNLSLAGYDDWRLPNIKELQSLVDYTRFDPSIDTSYFFNTMSDEYWSSTAFPDSSLDFVWVVFLQDGSVGIDHTTFHGYYSYYYVRAVRGGLCGDMGDSDGDTVCDNADNCIDDYNPFQTDCENDGAGDICDVDSIDQDADGVDVACDNCPNIANSYQVDNDLDGVGEVCENCPNHYNSDQEDTYPPQGNGIGDACECEADFMCDGDVDGSDASMFKFHFGRNIAHYQCTALDPCRGDFNCDGDVDGTDASLFKQDFGRNTFSNSCPACVFEQWCSYPLP